MAQVYGERQMKHSWRTCWTTLNDAGLVLPPLRRMTKTRLATG